MYLQLQFEKKAISYLKTLKREPQTQEQTQELRISDGMPDIGTVVGAWGQVILRSKEWNGDGFSVSGGTMVWVQYLPEEGGQPQCVETWLPFQMHWSLPPTQHDGVIHTQCFLCGVDARSTSARKMMVRSNVSVLGWAMEETSCEIFLPDKIPSDIQLLKNTYPVLLPVEAGEKAFQLEETLSLPPSAPKLEMLCGYFLEPEINEEKRVGDKVVFHGSGALHLQYLADDGGEYSWDFDIPFTQYAELDREYAESAQMQLIPSVTALELDVDADQLKVKAGLVCQYRILDQTIVEVVEDAYSPAREVKPIGQMLTLPAVLEHKKQAIRIQSNAPVDGMRLTDVQFLPRNVQTRMTGETAALELPGQFQLLYYDMDGNLSSAVHRWEETMTLPVAQTCSVETSVYPGSKPKGNFIGGNAQVNAEMTLSISTVSESGIPMVTGLEMEASGNPDPHRPSLILLRPGDKTLWQLAKENGSTIEAIRNANQLQAEPDPEQMLLLPIL